MSLRWKIAQNIELKWWKNYLKGKSPEDYLVWKKDYWRKTLKQLKIELKPGLKVLDAGCGPAGIFTILDQQRVTALDPLLNKYAKELPHFDPSKYNYCLFVNQSLEEYITQEPFDLIFCINAINHVDDISKAIKNLALNLRPGGKLIMTIDAHNYSLLKKIFQCIPGDILHPHQYDLADYQSMTEAAGFKIISSKKLKSEFIFDYWSLEAIKH